MNKTSNYMVQTKKEILIAIQGLLAGLGRDSGDEIYSNHRKIYEIGEQALPFLEEKILSISWSNTKYPGELKVLSGLLNVIHDIDEKRSHVIAEKIRVSGCSASASSRIKSITKFTLDNFHSYVIRGINIYVSKLLSHPEHIKNRVSKWISIVSKSDLKDIERIYLIPRQESDNVGTYMPFLSSIMVEWNFPFSYYTPLSSMVLIPIESTLYHEIGHHVCRHTFGQDPEQEKEADRYASRLLKKNHPMLRTLARVAGIFRGNSCGHNNS